MNSVLFENTYLYLSNDCIIMSFPHNYVLRTLELPLQSQRKNDQEPVIFTFHGIVICRGE